MFKTYDDYLKAISKRSQGYSRLFKFVQGCSSNGLVFIAIGLVDSLVDEMLLVSNQVCLGSSIRSMISMYY